MPLGYKAVLGLFAAVALGAALYVAAQGRGMRASNQHGSMDMSGMAMTQPSATAPSTRPADYSDVIIGPAVQQRIGVTLGRAEITPLVMSIRTVGIVRPDERKVAHIHLKTQGWVEKLSVSFTGQQVKAGDPMLTIYSPDFFTAQRDLLAALQVARTNPSPDQQIVVEAARRRLALWDVPKSQIDALEKTGKPGTALELRTPISGTVLEKKAFEGQYVMPQDELYLVADLTTVWVQAKVFEYELPHVEVGMPATVILPAVPDRPFSGKIVFIDPTVEEPARTVQVRIELPNQAGQFKPGMFAYVNITHQMGEGLTVASSAIMRTGARDIAFRVESQDRFVPVEVRIGQLRFGDRFQVLAGLKAGDAVVTSANFLIDSESRLGAGASSMAGMSGMEGMDMGGGKKPASPPTTQPQDRMKGMDMKGMEM